MVVGQLVGRAVDAAVLAAVPVAGEDRAAGYRNPCLMRHAHITRQPDDRGLWERGPGGVELVARTVHEFGLAVEDEDERPARRDHT